MRGLRPIDSASRNPGFLRVQIRLVCAVRDRFVSHPLAISESEVQTGISDLPALDGPFIHPKAAQRPKLLFVTASSRFRGRQLSPW